MTSADVFRRITSALEAAGIPYMLTGSFASSYHGSLRATQDIDLVIEADEERLRALVRSLAPTDYYVDTGYIERWVSALGVTTEWAAARSLAPQAGR